MLETIFKLIICHLVGDYIFQSDFIATTKGDNWYHLFVHCVLYSVPFYIVFGFTWQLIIIFISHIYVDSLKARYGIINYAVDQVLHYIIMLILYLL